MDTDLQVLHERVSRLEAILGPLPASKCIHFSFYSTRDRLRAIVSDEVVAAARAIRMLSHATPQLRSLFQARRVRVTHAQNVVDHAVLMLQELEALTQGMRLGEFCIPADNEVELRKMKNRMQTLERQVGGEEKHVDALLAEFEAVTRRLNARIIALAELARSEAARADV